ncbi:4677_t:CDS:2 [Paraglomus brasilianum]|uniref:Mediator of RNA polymerase II transcription subunit 13 n=1 Tax=Paraglomus brasilianum TaxID=144538 RepID=A0A9N9GEB0_9GLOM|nr:4677_t:CDS:2 [Paraglomus brasilianum]
MAASNYESYVEELSTNILCLAGLAKVSYKTFTYTSSTEDLQQFWKITTGLPSESLEGISDPLIRAYVSLLAAGVPCAWRWQGDYNFLSFGERLNCTRELWVFWLNQGNNRWMDSVQALKEESEGSFSFEDLESSGLQYGLFVRSLKNLISRGLMRHGAVPLGEWHLALSSLDKPISEGTPAVRVNVNLSSTNLLVAPYIVIRHVRPLEPSDLKKDGTRILLAPLGKEGSIVGSGASILKEEASAILAEFQTLAGLSFSRLNLPCKSDLPTFCIVRLVVGEVTKEIPYPTCAIFVISGVNVRDQTRLAGLGHKLSCLEQDFRDQIGNWLRICLERGVPTTPHPNNEKLHKWNIQESQAFSKYSPSLKQFDDSVLPDEATKMDFFKSERPWRREALAKVNLDTQPPSKWYQYEGAVYYVERERRRYGSRPGTDLTYAYNQNSIGPETTMTPNTPGMAGGSLNMKSPRQPLTPGPSRTGTHSTPNDQEPPAYPSPPDVAPSDEPSTSPSIIPLDSTRIINGDSSAVMDVSNYHFSDSDGNIEDEDFDWFDDPTPAPPSTSIDTPAVIQVLTPQKAEEVRTIEQLTYGPGKPRPYTPPEYTPLAFNYSVDSSKYLRAIFNNPLKRKRTEDETVSDSCIMDNFSYTPSYVPECFKKKQKVDEAEDTAEDATEDTADDSGEETDEDTVESESEITVDDAEEVSDSTDIICAKKEHSREMPDAADIEGESWAVLSCSEDEEEHKEESNHIRKLQMENCSRFIMMFDYQLLEEKPPIPQSRNMHKIKEEESRKLCEASTCLKYQVVLAPYPFAGEYKTGETTRVTIERNRLAMEAVRGGVKSTVAPPAEAAGVFNLMVDVLKDMSETIKPSEQMSDVSVRGPLTISEFQALNEQHRYPNSKFISKTKQPEPNLQTLGEPQVTIAHDNDDIVCERSILKHWTEQKLKPLGGKKDILWFAVYPATHAIRKKNADNRDVIRYTMRDKVKEFCCNIGACYEACNLGKHVAGDLAKRDENLGLHSAAKYLEKDITFTEKIVKFTQEREAAEEERRRKRDRAKHEGDKSYHDETDTQIYERVQKSITQNNPHRGLYEISDASRKQLAEPIVDVYIRESADIGKEIAHPIFRRKGKDIVIYFINIFTHTTAYLDICKCFVALKESLCESLKKRGYQPNVTLQIVPIEHVLHHNTNFDKLKSGCEEIAFSVYNRAMLALALPYEVGDEPAEKSVKAVNVENTDTRHPTIVYANETLHVSYAFSFDRQWIVCLWTDDKGRHLESCNIPSRGKKIRELLDDIWKRTVHEVKLRHAFTASQVLVCKLGEMSREERDAWLQSNTDSQPQWSLLLVCVDIHSCLDLMPVEGIVLHVDPDRTPAEEGKVLQGAGRKVSGMVLNHPIPINDMRPAASGYILETFRGSRPSTAIKVTLMNNPTNNSTNVSTDRKPSKVLWDIIRKYNRLGYVDSTPLKTPNIIPNHLLVTERMMRVFTDIPTY